MDLSSKQAAAINGSIIVVFCDSDAGDVPLQGQLALQTRPPYIIRLLSQLGGGLRSCQRDNYYLNIVIMDCSRIY